MNNIEINLYREAIAWLDTLSSLPPERTFHQTKANRRAVNTLTQFGLVEVCEETSIFGTEPLVKITPAGAEYARGHGLRVNPAWR